MEVKTVVDDDVGALTAGSVSPPRAGWAEASRRIAAAGEGILPMWDFPNEDDGEFVW